MIKKKKTKRRKEYSKILLNRITVLTFIVTAFSLGAMYWLRDISSLSTLLSLVFAEYAVGTAFYYNKAKAENKLKIMKKYKEAGILPEEMREKHLLDEESEECHEDMS